MLARRFLYLVAAAVALLLAAGIAWALFSRPLMRAAFVPAGRFAPVGAAPDYRRADSWVARPDRPADPARWLPPGVPRTAAGPAAVFFVAPTSYLDRAHWNATLHEPSAEPRLRLFVAGQASVFAAAGRIWAPRYRQATIGAFLTDAPDSARALDFAYADVAAAFDAFLAQAPADAPLILAGHSQGSLHLLRLLRERVAGRPLARRIVAGYAPGWPVSTVADLPALGLPACTRADQPGCLLSWLSFADPADPAQLLTRYEASTGPTGIPRRGTPALCVDPLTGTRGGAASAAANPGALVPDQGFGGGRLVAGVVGARCRRDGILAVDGVPPGFGAAVLPGNNYHVFDYALFWARLRADALARLAAWERAR